MLLTIQCKGVSFLNIKQLILFEYKTTPYWYFLLLFSLPILFGTLACIIIDSSFAGRKLVAIDTLFLIVGVALQLCRFHPFVFPTRMHATPFHLLLRRMSISEKTLIWSRFLTALPFQVVFYLLFLTTVYFFQPVFKQEFQLYSLLMFTLLWTSVGIAISSLYLSIESGTKLSPMWHGIIGGVSVLPLLLLVNVVYNVTNTGIVKGLVFLVNTSYPLAVIISILSLTFSYFIWKWRVTFSMKKVDFHV